jgi:hypothetical protein
VLTAGRAMILRKTRPAAWLAPDPRPVHRPGNGGPGIVRALFGVTWHRPVEGDRPLGAPRRGRTRRRGRCPSRHRPRPPLHRSCHACGNLASKPRSAALCLPLELARLRRRAQHRAGATAASESGRLRDVRSHPAGKARPRSSTGSLTRGAALRKLIYPASGQSPRSGEKTYWHRPEAALWNQENLRSSTRLHLWYPHGRSAGSPTRDQHAGGPAQSGTATNNEVLQHWRGELCAGMLDAGTSAAKSVEQGIKSQERHR